MALNSKLTRILDARRRARTGMSYAELRRERARETRALRKFTRGQNLKFGPITLAILCTPDLETALDDLGGV